MFRGQVDTTDLRELCGRIPHTLEMRFRLVEKHMPRIGCKRRRQYADRRSAM
jgi:hypothetical protein